MGFQSVDTAAFTGGEGLRIERSTDATFDASNPARPATSILAALRLIPCKAASNPADRPATAACSAAVSLPDVCTATLRLFWVALPSLKETERSTSLPETRCIFRLTLLVAIDCLPPIDVMSTVVC